MNTPGCGVARGREMFSVAPTRACRACIVQKYVATRGNAAIMARTRRRTPVSETMHCPRCNSILCTVEDNGVHVEVCPDCKGEWLHAGELATLVEHHDKKFSPEEIASLDAVNKEVFTPAECEHDELHCPHCVSVEMNHFNYGDTSGIILDKCPQCGGIWTDKGELEKVEELVDGWKSYLNQDEATYGPILRKIEIEEQKEADKSVSISRFGFVNAILRRLCE